jgi:hypothetical protein
MNAKAGFFALALAAALNVAQAANTAAVNDVLKLKAAGFNDDAIVAFIQGKNLNYELSADEAIALARQGVPSRVLNAMMASGAAATPAPYVPAAVYTPASPTVYTVPQPQPAPTVVQPALPPDAAYFYQELSPHGRWILAEDSQWFWQPTVAINNPAWRPYWDNGRWVYTDQGWYWSSDYPWGWAAFHYGRWQLHPHHGWVWLPDHVWGPAWVAWRSGGDYCGWAPLPPGAVYDSARASFVFRGKRVGVEFDFGLNDAHFSFCFVKDMGSSGLRHIREEEEHAVFRRSAIIAGYNVVTIKGEDHPRIVNRGIEVERVTTSRGRPVEAVRIQDLRKPVAVGRAPERFDPKEKTIDVYRPKVGGHDGHDKKSWWSR